jgi:hypothetical protein
MIGRHASPSGQCGLFVPASMPASHISKKDEVHVSDTGEEAHAGEN